MTDDLLHAAHALADTLAAENQALSRLDFSRATMLLGAKQRAADGFAAAARDQRLAPPMSPPG